MDSMTKKVGIRWLRLLPATVLILNHIMVNVRSLKLGGSLGIGFKGLGIGVGRGRSYARSTKTSLANAADFFAVHEPGVSLPLKVYLEDTDMYGIVFNSNYLKYAKRALHEILPDSSVIVQMDEMRFVAPAVLGDDLLVKGEMLHPSTEDDCSLSRSAAGISNMEGDGGDSKWNFNMISQKDGKAFCTAQVVVSTVFQAQALEPSPGALEKICGCTHQLPVVVWPDELDGNSQIQPSTVLSYMERLRTLSLGNNGLTKLFKEGYTIVVSKVKNFGCRYNVSAKDHLLVRTSYQPKKRSIVAYQSVWKVPPPSSGNMGDDFSVKKIYRSNKLQVQQESLENSNINATTGSSDIAAMKYHKSTLVENREVLVSWAEVELLCLDNESRKLRKFPGWVQEMFTVCPVV